MGFGSYDESEQGDQNVDFDEEDGVTASEEKHEGRVGFEIDASNDELLDRFQEVKDE